MKYTIEGFSQEFALTLKKEVEQNGKTITRGIDCTDLVILRWFVDFYPNMKKVEVDGRQYAFLSHKKLIEDLPLIDISKKAFIERMKKLVEFDVLTYKFLKENGSISLYGFGANYMRLVDGVTFQTDTGCAEMAGGNLSNGYGVTFQTDNKNNSNINTSISDIKYIVGFLNSATSSNYRYQTKATQRLINARLNEGFTVDDFKAVIDKKAKEWKGTEMAQYLRPETLFGTKFESYLNAPKASRKTAQATFDERTYTKEELNKAVTPIDELANIEW